MKNFFIAIICCLSWGSANAQSETRIKSFSEKYYAKVITKADSSSYYIQVYEKGTNKRLINATAEQISGELVDENNQLIPNIKELPYGDQSVLIYEDFNFDGIKDFAIMNGFQSCYSGPSFDIYLFSNNRFVYNAGFSALSNEYCGMFQVDAQKKKIMTMTKSGCCWHQFSEYIVKKNVPVAVKIVEEDATGNNSPYFVHVTTKELIGGSMKEKEQLYMPYDNVDTVYAFKLKKNNKTVCIFEQDSVLYYSLIRQDGSIEFYYPAPYYDDKKETFSFMNKGTHYEIYKVGVRIQMPDSTVVLEGDPSSVKGAGRSPASPAQTNPLHFSNN